MRARFLLLLAGPLLLVVQPDRLLPAPRAAERPVAASPKQVYVVNTGDASVSLVDLDKMTEV